MKTIQIVETELENLKVGQTMLTYVRPISEGKFSVEIAEVIKNPNQNTALSILNASDSRFTPSFSIRRGYITVSSEKELALLGVSLKGIELTVRVTLSGVEQKVYVIGKLNPSIQDTQLKLRIIERVFSEMDSIKDKWDLENVRSSAKQDGNGNYLLANDQLIFSKIEVTNAQEYSHRRILHTAKTTSPEQYLVPNIIIEDVSSEVVESKAPVAAESL